MNGTARQHQDVLPFFPAVDKQAKARKRRADAVEVFEEGFRRAVGAHVRIGRLQEVFARLVAELEPFEEGWKKKRRDDDRRRRARRSRERNQHAKALEAIRNGKRGEVIVACIRAAAEVVGCERRAILSQTRGKPCEALARVVAMHACVCLGVPMQATAEAFKRSRRSVHSALEIGRPGRENRDQEVLTAMRAVVARVKIEQGRKNLLETERINES